MTLAEAIVSGGIESPGELQEQLRRTYPHVIVRARDLNGEAVTIWYVYRDGHWIQGLGEADDGG